MKAVLIEWYDSCTTPRWCDAADGELQLCVTVGIEVRRDAKSVTVAISYNGGTKYLDQLTIAMACVKKIRRLK